MVTDMLARGHDPSLTNLGHFHAEANFEALRSGDFTTVKQLSKAIHGEVLKARWTAQREPVAVKKWQNKRVHKPHREFCERTLHQHGGREETEPEDPLTEIGIFNYLSRSDRSCPYVLKMLGSFQDATHTYLVTEFADGGDLFTVAAKVKLHESQTRRYVCQLLQAISFLHSSHVGHRDVSLENALLKDGTVKVMDFGMAVQSHSARGEPLRYFRTVGKDTYRAPECYVPRQREVRLQVPAEARPADVIQTPVNLHHCEVKLPTNAVPGDFCNAPLCGYTVPPVDVFACGVCFFSLSWQVPPWKRAHLTDQYFAYIHRHGDTGIDSLVQIWGKPPLCPAAMRLMSQMLTTLAVRRPTADSCLCSEWFAEGSLPLHAPTC